MALSYRQGGIETAVRMKGYTCTFLSTKGAFGPAVRLSEYHKARGPAHWISVALIRGPRGVPKGSPMHPASHRRPETSALKPAASEKVVFPGPDVSVIQGPAVEPPHHLSLAVSSVILAKIREHLFSQMGSRFNVGPKFKTASGCRSGTYIRELVARE